MGGQRWKVVGGTDKGGILVREGKDLKSKQLDDRLATGTVVEEQALEGDRLSYRKVAGEGPDSGWVSIRSQDKPLLVHHDETDKPLAASADAAAEAEGEATDSGGPAPGCFSGEGRTLGSSSPLFSAAAETPQERRLRALEAAEKRYANVPGISEKKQAELRESQARDELLRRLTDHYSRRGEELPLGLRHAPLEQLRQHWEGRDREAAAPAPAQEERRAPGAFRAFSSRLAKQSQEDQERKMEEERSRAQEQRREEEEERARKAEEQQRQAREAEHARAEAERQALEAQIQREIESRREVELLHKTPRSRIMCASPGCQLAVHSRPELGGYCCIACSEGGDHGPRCERILAPVDAIKANQDWMTVGGDQLEDMELEEALRLSMLEADVPASVLGHIGTALPNKGKSVEDLEMEEAMRLSMLDAMPAGQEAQEIDQEALELEEAIRLSQLINAPAEPSQKASEAEVGEPPGDSGEEASDDDDDEVPDLVPIEQT